MRYRWIYDTPALVGHANGTSNRVRAGLHLTVTEQGFQLTVPATCMLEAYQQVSPEAQELLGWLATSPGISLVPVGGRADEIATIGQLIGDTGRPGAAHAAHLALAGEGPYIVFTDVQMPSGVLSRSV